MPVSFLHVINDRRTDLNSIPELGNNNLAGQYLYYDSDNNIYLNKTNLFDESIDIAIPIILRDPPSKGVYSADDWIIDLTEDELLGEPYIDNTDNPCGFFPVHNVQVKRNRSFFQLFDCTNEFDIEDNERIGYNTVVKLGDISNNSIYAGPDIMLYRLDITGEATFYFSPQPKSGWLSCVKTDDFKRQAKRNLDYISNKNTALSPCDDEGWRTVINGEYYGFEFNLYVGTAKTKNWWDKIIGLGHNIKVRFLDQAGNPLPMSAWYPVMDIKTGLDQFSSLGATTNVYKIEARYVEIPNEDKDSSGKVISTYRIFNITQPSDTWIINHELNSPKVHIETYTINNSGDPEALYPITVNDLDDNKSEVKWNDPTTGYAKATVNNDVDIRDVKDSTVNTVRIMKVENKFNIWELNHKLNSQNITVQCYNEDRSVQLYPKNTKVVDNDHFNIYWDKPTSGIVILTATP